MEKWKYKYSFFSGILFIVTFILKELVVNSPEKVSVTIFMLPFLFMILYVLGLFLGFLKYAILNEKRVLKMSVISMMVFYSLIIIIEFIDRISGLSNTNPGVIVLIKLLLGAALIFFAIALIIQKKIYGKHTILQWISSFLLGVTFFIPFLNLFQLPLFLIFFISLTYLVNKKIKEKVYEGRLL